MRRLRLNVIGLLVVAFALAGCPDWTTESRDGSPDVAHETSVVTDAADAVDAGPATLAAIQVTPVTVLLRTSATQRYAALGRYSDDSVRDITTAVEWRSSNPAVATIDTAGVARGVAAGTTMISASLGGIDSNLGTITVSDDRVYTLGIDPATVTLVPGTSAMLRAIGTFPDATTRDFTTEAEWTSSDPSIVAVSDAPGSVGRIIAGTTAGEATITARFDGRSATARVRVGCTAPSSITVGPAAATVFVGHTLVLRATAHYADGSTAELATDVTWSSSDTNVATVAASTGILNAIHAGSVTVTASFATTCPAAPVVTGTRTIAVEAPVPTAIVVTPATASLAPGATAMLRASIAWSDGSTTAPTGAVAWSSSNAVAATVDASGLVTAACAGRATIAAESMGLHGSAEIEVTGSPIASIALTPADSRIGCDMQQLRAIATGADGSSEDVTSRTLRWESSAPTVAFVSSTGQVTGAASGGPVTVTASYCGVTASTTVTVACDRLQHIAIDPAAPTTFVVDGTRTYRVFGHWSDGSVRELNTDSRLTFTSSLPSVATVSNADGSRGLVTAVTAGTTRLSATYTVDGRTYTAPEVTLSVSNH